MTGQLSSPLIELKEQRCWDLLATKRVGRLAVSVMNRPDIFPVNYQLDGQHLVIQSAPGDKLAAATLGAGVAFEVDALDEESGTGWSIVVKGRAHQIENLAEYLRAQDLEIKPWADGVKLRFMRIDADSITGRQIR